MSALVTPTAADLAAFRVAVASVLGLHFDDGRIAHLGEVFAGRLAARALRPAEYLIELAAAGSSHAEVRALARALTIGETYFFRHAEQLRAFTEVALPDRLHARADARVLRLLSVGCASGEEPYSLAIMLREQGLNPSWKVSIRAVDLNADALQRAARARYSAWSLRETPAEVRRRWFVEAGGEATLDPRIRAAVTFEERNLAADEPALWPHDFYDVIFARNVLMYLTPAVLRRAVANLTRALTPGGYLFLGHADTLRGLSDAFHLRQWRDAFFYQRKDGDAPALVDDLAAVEVRPPPEPTPELPRGWHEHIRDSHERVSALAIAPPSDEKTGVASDLDAALDLVAIERFVDAIAALDALPATRRAEVEVLLLRAAVLLHTGDSGEAEAIAGAVLARDERNAGACYVLALCRDGAGDRLAAIDHDRLAARFDPTFAMPRLHLGLLARRVGAAADARRDLGDALRLLQHEDPRRLLLFGGGFDREGLVALCRSEMGRLGGAP